VTRFKRVGAVALLIHAVGLVSWVTIRVFGDNPPDIPAGTATALAAVYGLPALSFGVAKIRRKVRYATSRY
jgi:hypothetical protein